MRCDFEGCGDVGMVWYWVCVLCRPGRYIYKYFSFLCVGCATKMLL